MYLLIIINKLYIKQNVNVAVGMDVVVVVGMVVKRVHVFDSSLFIYSIFGKLHDLP